MGQGRDPLVQMGSDLNLESTGGVHTLLSPNAKWSPMVQKPLQSVCRARCQTRAAATVLFITTWSPCLPLSHFLGCPGKPWPKEKQNEV